MSGLLRGGGGGGGKRVCWSPLKLLDYWGGGPAPPPGLALPTSMQIAMLQIRQ